VDPARRGAHDLGRLALGQRTAGERVELERVDLSPGLRGGRRRRARRWRRRRARRGARLVGERVDLERVELGRGRRPRGGWGKPGARRAGELLGLVGPRAIRLLGPALGPQLGPLLLEGRRVVEQVEVAALRVDLQPVGDRAVALVGLDQEPLQVLLVAVELDRVQMFSLNES